MKHKAILLIDDDEDDQLIFIDAVKEVNPGIVCLTADNGGDAYLQLEKSSPAPSLIFLDLNMPDMHGIEVLRFVRKHQLYRTIPVIVLTTRGDEDSRVSALEAGATLYLTKPFAPRTLAAQVNDLLAAK